MIPAALVNDAGRAQRSLVTLAQRDLLRTWRGLDLSDAVAVRDVLLARVEPILVAYGDVAAVQAADFYDEARLSSGPRGTYRAQPTGPVPQAQIAALVRWSVGPLFSAEPDAATALSLLSGGLTRLLREPERQTIYQATQNDPASPRFARVPQAGACDWCLMLASRGGVYRTEDTATTGQRGMAFHDRCGCQAMPIWTPDDLPQINRDLQDEWDAVTAGHADQLAAWREHIAATRGT